jgi:5'-nucleotidase
MRILLTNDDGINAAGLQTLEKAALRLGGEIVVVAPEAEHSAQSHAITVRQPVFARRLSRSQGEYERIAVTGTPCDCVRLACIKLLDKMPDLCLTGINHGANLGWDVFFSGTVSAAAEAHSFGIPSIAFSLATWNKPDWTNLDLLVADLLRSLLAAKHTHRNFLYSVNIPPVSPLQMKGAKITRPEPTTKGDNFEEREAPDGRTYYWPTWDERKAAREKITDERYDSAAVRAGYIAITPLRYDVSAIEDTALHPIFSDYQPDRALR